MKSQISYSADICLTHACKLPVMRYSQALYEPKGMTASETRQKRKWKCAGCTPSHVRDTTIARQRNPQDIWRLTSSSEGRGSRRTRVVVRKPAASGVATGIMMVSSACPTGNEPHSYWNDDGELSCSNSCLRTWTSEVYDTCIKFIDINKCTEFVLQCQVV
jgi:hypothetical protein